MTDSSEGGVDKPSSEALEEYIPGFLMPAYERYLQFTRVRDHWAPTVVYYGEILLTVALTVGLVYWIYLFLVVG